MPRSCLALAVHGAVLFPVSAAGLGWISGRKGGRPWRPIGIAAQVAARPRRSDGKAYYAIGSAPLFMAAGGIVVDRWVSTGSRRREARRIRPRCDPLGELMALIDLPILPSQPTPRLPSRRVPDTANEVGWPQFVAKVWRGPRTHRPERAHAIILTNDYSEASPLILLGTGLPPVYSGHNAYW